MCVSMFYLGAFIKIKDDRSGSSGTAVSSSTAAAGRGATAAIMIFGASFAASINGLAWILVRTIHHLQPLNPATEVLNVHACRD